MPLQLVAPPLKSTIMKVREDPNFSNLAATTYLELDTSKANCSMISVPNHKWRLCKLQKSHETNMILSWKVYSFVIFSYWKMLSGVMVCKEAEIENTALLLQIVFFSSTRRRLNKGSTFTSLFQMTFLRTLARIFQFTIPLHNKSEDVTLVNVMGLLV